MSAPEGATKKRKRRGRGESSGLGKTAGRGGKGQTARTGKGKPGRGFEGGQMPMYRRMPKRGFVNAGAARTAAINVDMLTQRFVANKVVSLKEIIDAGLASKGVTVFRVIGRGDCAHALTIKAHHVSASAKEKIEAAGGKVELVDDSKEA